MLLKQYYIILFIAITSRSCNGPAVRIKLIKPWGKMVKNKNKNKKYIQQRKNSLAKGRTYSIYTEGRHLLDHCATLQE